MMMMMMMMMMCECSWAAWTGRITWITRITGRARTKWFAWTTRRERNSRPSRWNWRTGLPWRYR